MEERAQDDRVSLKTLGHFRARGQLLLEALRTSPGFPGEAARWWHMMAFIVFAHHPEQAERFNRWDHFGDAYPSIHREDHVRRMTEELAYLDELMAAGLQVSLGPRQAERYRPEPGREPYNDPWRHPQRSRRSGSTD